MTRKGAPAFQFYPDDWLSSKDITLMSAAEEGAYIRLLSYAWLADDCGLPDDATTLASLSRLGDDWRGQSGEKIRAKFRKRRGRLYNDRLLEERRKQKEHHKKSSLGGLKSATSRASKRVKGGSRLVATKLQPPPHPLVDDWLQPKGNSSSSSSSSIRTPPTPSLDQAFHDLVDRYPNPTKIDEAGRCWVSLTDSGEITEETVSEVFSGLDRWLASDVWATDDGRYVPSLLRWLQGRRWKDQPRAAETDEAVSQVVPEHLDDDGSLKPEYEQLRDEPWPADGLPSDLKDQLGGAT